MRRVSAVTTAFETHLQLDRPDASTTGHVVDADNECVCLLLHHTYVVAGCWGCIATALHFCCASLPM
eukprot:scaffold12540_cov21-Tisochrysis_lutea.AAC.3